VHLAASTANGFSSTAAGASGIGGTFSDIDNLTGSGNADTLTGYGADTAWNLSAAPTVVADGNTLNVAHNTFETFTGNANIDTFTVSANTTASLNGSAGADSFTVNAAFTLTGAINGGTGNDYVEIKGTVAGLDVGWVTGGVDGGADTDTLKADSGLVTGKSTDTSGLKGFVIGTPTPAQDTAFDNIDITIFNSLTLSNGDDSVSYNGTNWNLTQFNGVAVGPINVGNPTTINTLDGNDTFTVTGGTLSGTTMNAGVTAGSVTDKDKLVVTGGTVDATSTFFGYDDNDTLDFGASVTDFFGVFNGGIGVDDVKLNGLTVDSVLTVTGAGASGLNGSVDVNPGGATGAINDVDVLTGKGTTQSSLTVSGAAAADFVIGASNSLTVGGKSATFSGFRKLVSGTGTNTVTVNDFANAGSSIYEFDGTAGATTLTVNDTADAVGQIYTLNSSGVTRQDGPSINLINVDNVVVSGGTADDTFAVTASTTVLFTVNGGLGNDTLNIYYTDNQSATQTGTSASGNFSFPGLAGYQNINWTSVESRNDLGTVDSTAPSVTVDTDAFGGVITGITDGDFGGLGVVSVEVSITDGVGYWDGFAFVAGPEIFLPATDLGFGFDLWSLTTSGIPLATYTVHAKATDAVGNVGNDTQIVTFS
jgi:hypothetical protein